MLNVNNQYKTNMVFEWQKSTEKPVSLSVQIFTERLMICPVTREDAQLMNYCFYSHEETMRSFRKIGSESFEETVEWTRESEELWNHNEPIGACLKAIDRKTHELVGVIGIYPGQASFGVSIEYIIHKHKWTQGYGTELVKAITEEFIPALRKEGYLVKQTNIQNQVLSAKEPRLLEANVLPGNKGSETILKKLGFGCTGMRGEHLVFIKFLSNA